MTIKTSKKLRSLEKDEASGFTMVDDPGVESKIGIFTTVYLSGVQDILKKI